MKREYILELIAKVTNNRPMAEEIVERLTEEGLLNLYYGDQGIGKVLDTFSECFGTTRTSKYDRFAANRLVKKHGLDATVQIIEILAKLMDKPFAPTVNDVSQLEKKFPQVIKFIRTNAGELKEIEL